MVNAPDDVLGAVAADAKVGGVKRRVVFVPDIRAVIAPEISDGIAEKQKVNATFFVDGHELRVPLMIVFGIAANRRNDGGVILIRVLRERGRVGEQKRCGDGE